MPVEQARQLDYAVCCFSMLRQRTNQGAKRSKFAAGILQQAAQVRNALKHADLLRIETKESNVQALIIERLNRARLSGHFTEVQKMLRWHGLQHAEGFVQHGSKSHGLVQQTGGCGEKSLSIASPAWRMAR